MAKVLGSFQEATRVRQSWGSFIDMVVHGSRPIVVKRNRDLFTAISVDLLNEMLEPYELAMVHHLEDDQSVTGALQEIDLVGHAESLDALRLALARDLVDYAKEYWENFDQYRHAPNRRAHLPHVLRVLLQPDVKHVAELIHA